MTIEAHPARWVLHISSTVLLIAFVVAVGALRVSTPVDAPIGRSIEPAPVDPTSAAELQQISAERI